MSSVGLVITYPLMKRITNWVHLHTCPWGRGRGIVAAAVLGSDHQLGCVVGMVGRQRQLRLEHLSATLCIGCMLDTHV